MLQVQVMWLCVAVEGHDADAELFQAIPHMDFEIPAHASLQSVTTAVRNSPSPVQFSRKLQSSPDTPLELVIDGSKNKATDTAKLKKAGSKRRVASHSPVSPSGGRITVSPQRKQSSSVARLSASTSPELPATLDRDASTSPVPMMQQ
jgi:hypothetical protein